MGEIVAQLDRAANRRFQKNRSIRDAHKPPIARENVKKSNAKIIAPQKRHGDYDARLIPGSRRKRF